MNLTVSFRFHDQAAFTDKSEVLLSEEARIVTYVHKNGQRETLSLDRVLCDQR